MNDLHGGDFEKEMTGVAMLMDEDDVEDLISAIAELYPDRVENEDAWEKYETLSYFVFLTFGDVHYFDFGDEKYQVKMDGLIRSLGFDNLADYGMENFTSRRHKSTDVAE